MNGPPATGGLGEGTGMKANDKPVTLLEQNDVPLKVDLETARRIRVLAGRARQTPGAYLRELIRTEYADRAGDLLVDEAERRRPAR